MKKRLLCLRVLPLVLLFVFNSARASDNPNEERQTFQLEKPYSVQKIINKKKSDKPKNVILMIGDGMSLSVMYSAWTANRGHLYVDNCEYVGLSKTYSANYLITDSGAGATAIATGHKTNVEYVGIDADETPHDSILEIAKENNLSAGIIVTCSLLDATPSGFIAKTTDRHDYQEIAKQYVKCNADFIFGGGREGFEKDENGTSLLKEISQRGFQTPRTIDEVEKIESGKVFAIVAENNLPLYKERGETLSKASLKAIELLKQNENGFFLMIEGSMIDDQAHGESLENVMNEMFDFDHAIGEVLKWAAEDGETLVVITADHETGGLTLVDGNITTGEITCNFSTGGHSGVMVPVYSFGPTSETFTGIYENTDLFKKIIRAYGFETDGDKQALK